MSETSHCRRPSHNETLSKIFLQCSLRTEAQRRQDCSSFFIELLHRHCGPQPTQKLLSSLSHSSAHALSASEPQAGAVCCLHRSTVTTTPVQREPNNCKNSVNPTITLWSRTVSFQSGVGGTGNLSPINTINLLS